MDLAGLGAIGGIHDRALFHLGNLRRHANHDARMHQHLPVMGLLDEVVQHLLGDFEVSDDAVFHGLDGDDVARRAAEHLLGFFADASTSPVNLLMATMEGSLTTMPLTL